MPAAIPTRLEDSRMQAMTVSRSQQYVIFSTILLTFTTIVHAQGRGARTIPDDPSEVIQTLHGFKLDLVLRSDPQKHGSWISMATDSKGRLL